MQTDALPSNAGDRYHFVYAARRMLDKIEGFSFEVMEKTAREVTGREDLSLPSTEELPASFAGVGMTINALEPSIYVMLHDAYEPVADCARNPETKAFVWVLMNVYRLLVMHCTHRLGEDDPALARAAREFCEEALA
ncbi:MAG TPA: hypothetical protein VJ464_23580 [Blastocatellia bacterium]|nr:hypothetical protein [Blastocatellia bacterium]